MHLLPVSSLFFWGGGVRGSHRQLEVTMVYTERYTEISPSHLCKLSISMGTLGELVAARLDKERRIGPGGKPSNQKSPCGAVVGSRPGVGTKQQPG